MVVRWKEFRDWFWEKHRGRFYTATPHEKIYLNILLESKSYSKAVKRIREMEEEYGEYGLLQDFEYLWEMFEKETHSVRRG